MDSNANYKCCWDGDLPTHPCCSVYEQFLLLCDWTVLHSVAVPHSVPCGRMRAASTLLLGERCCCHAMMPCSSRILALIPLGMYTRVGFLGHEYINVLVIFLHAVCLLMKWRRGTGCRSSSVGQVLDTNICLF